MEKIPDDKKIQFRAEKICVKRPTRGEVLDMAIWGSLVAHFLDQDAVGEGIRGT